MYCFRFASLWVIWLFTFSSFVQGDIYRWDTGEVIPGTEGIVPGPGIDLRHWGSDLHNLRYADFSGELDLSNAMFYGSWLDNARFAQANLVEADFRRALLTSADLSQACLWKADFSDATLINADLSQTDLMEANFYWGSLSGANLHLANLTGANMNEVTVTGADLTDAVVKRAFFQQNSHGPLTKQQLYSTASYKAKDLEGIGLSQYNLAYWNFAEQNLVGAYFGEATLTDVAFTDAVVTMADFRESGITKEQLYSTASYKAKDLVGIGLSGNDLSGWDFTDAVVTMADFRESGITKEQFYSTASYKAKDLVGIGLSGNDLSSWDFAGHNLEGADFGKATLTDVNLTDAAVKWADFLCTTSRGFTKEQLYSTASYRVKDLEGIRLSGDRSDTIDLSGWDFAGQNLTEAYFKYADLTNADLRQANLTSASFHRATLTDANLTDAVVTGANFRASGITTEQLYSTASYQAKDLVGIWLSTNDLSGWDFAGINLEGAGFPFSNLTNADLSQTNLLNADFAYSTLTGANLNLADLSHAFLAGATLTDTDLSQANLTDVNFFSATLTGVDFSAADTRGSLYWSPASGELITRNMIFPDGVIHGLDIQPGEMMRLWDYDPKTPLPIEVHDAMQIDADGTLRIVIEDDLWGSTLMFGPEIDVLLDGTLELLIDPDEETTLASLVGVTFELFDWTGISPIGQFNRILTGDDLIWDTADLYTTGNVILIDAPGYQPGDFDCDYDVDGFDFLKWQRGESTNPLSQSDLDDWRANLGNEATSVAAASTPVPEPSTLALLILTVGLYSIRRTINVRQS